MLTYQVIATAIIQGITELFPVSSVGHAVLVPYLLGWTNVLNEEQFLPFVVMLHLGTAVALLLYFWRDWIGVVGALVPGTQPPEERRRNLRILVLLVVATIPAAVIGKVLENPIRHLFSSPVAASLFLVVNGAILFVADRLRDRADSRALHELSWVQSLCIGILEALALFPGISRSGITLSAGRWFGMNYQDAARFSFLLAAPVILGAAVLEVPKVIRSHDAAMLHAGLFGGVTAGICAWLATAFLMRYFGTHEVRALRPFATYCTALGLICLVLWLCGFHR